MPYLKQLPKKWDGSEQQYKAQKRYHDNLKRKLATPDHLWVRHLPAYILDNGQWCYESQIIHCFE
jgi:hypothetical protein